MEKLFRLSHVQANGITHRVAVVKGCFEQRSLPDGAPPLVVLLHGWPESWYSWRHQLVALASHAGLPVCAPDMRGYGGTDAPGRVEDYEVDKLCLDVLGIAKVLGHDRIISVGHDFGSYLSWHLALMHPDQVVAVCGMSVPYLGHSPRHEPMLERLQRDFGKCLPQNGASRKEQEEARFHYMLHHNLPRADEEYDRNRYEALYRLYAFTKGIEADDPEVTDRHMFPHSHQCSDDDNAPLDARSAPGFWARLPRPKSLPSWLSESDFQYYLNEYERSGFSGGLRWYQAMDRNWHLTKSLQGKQIHQPALFLCGKEDHLVLKNHGGEDHVIRIMNEHCTNLKTHMIPNAGHWIQQEVPELVTDQLLCFLSSLHVHRGESQTQSKL